MKTWLKYGAVGVIVFGLGAAVGRFSLPVRVETREKIVEKKTEQVTIVQEVDIKALLKTLRESEQRNNVVTVREIVRLPNGTVTERTKTEDKTESKAKDSSESSTITHMANDMRLLREELKLKDSVKIVGRDTSKWAVGAAAGYHLPTLAGQSGFNLVPVPGVVIGVHVSHKLLGPVWGGVWVNSMGTVGIQTEVRW